MSSDGRGIVSLQQDITDAGWHQGSLLPPTSLSFACNDIEEDAGSKRIVVKVDRISSQSKLVLVTQTCDIVADIKVEPNVEAMICFQEPDRGKIRSWDRNSARYFPISPSEGLVASAQTRLQLSKQVLISLTPQPWPSDSLRFDRFVRWLARRYDRPAIPDALVASLQNPLREVLKQLDRRTPALGDAFNRAVREVRALLPLGETPPFDTQLILLVKRGELSAEEADSITQVLKSISGAIDFDVVHLAQEIIASPDEIALGYYERSIPLYLDYLTYRGDEIILFHGEGGTGGGGM